MTVLTNHAPGSASPLKTLDQVLSTVRETNSPRASWYQSGGLLNNRRAHRVAFPETLLVVGLTTTSRTGHFVPITEPIIAQGRDVSVGGISFQHADPLPHRYVAVSFRSTFGTETLVARLSWCRFALENYYVSGGRLAVNPQLDAEMNIDWDSLPTE